MRTLSRYPNLSHINTDSINENARFLQESNCENIDISNTNDEINNNIVLENCVISNDDDDSSVTGPHNENDQEIFLEHDKFSTCASMSSSDSNDITQNYSDSDDDTELREQSMVYENSRQTTDEAVLSVLQLYIKHKLTKNALKDALKTVCDMLPVPNNMPTTVFKLFKYITDLAPSCAIIKHYYCNSCQIYYDDKTEHSIQKCRTSTECLLSAGNTAGVFYELNVVDQIKYFFEHRNLYKIIVQQHEPRDSNVITDITDGSEYLRVNYSEAHKRGLYDLTLILNTDGLCLKKSSTGNCWPLMFTIAEIPKNLRNNFVIIIGIWYDNHKPSMNSFLQPFCEKFKTCFDEGVNWIHPINKTQHKSKVVVPLIVADAPARAQIQNIFNFNGRYGCNLCEIKTRKCKILSNKKRKRIYPFINEQQIILRTSKRLRVQGKKVQTRAVNNIRGTKGIPIISTLPLIDISTCMVPEFMHSVLLGPVKQFTNLWYESNGEWCVKNSLNNINEFLLKIRPPDSFNRMPRSLSLLHLYKASEWYVWLLFYSLPTMAEYLPDKYVQHWLLLVKAIYILLGNNILSKDIEEAETLLRLFVSLIEKLYGDRQLTYNVHMLLHLKLCVKRWGPLWAWSAFPFENFNGFLSRIVHSSKHIGQELVNNIIIAQGIQVLKNKVTKHALSPESIQNCIIGKPLKIVLNETEIRSEFLTSVGTVDQLIQIEGNDVLIYGRAKIFSEIYTSERYTLLKTNSYNVEFKIKNAESKQYGSIRLFFTKLDNVFFMFRPLTVIHKNMFYHRDTKTKVNHILPIKEENYFYIVQIKDIDYMYKLVRVGNYICKTPHSMKTIM